MAAKWGFQYMENLCWIKKHPNNKMVTEDSTFFKRSKLTLLIMRKVSNDLETQRIKGKQLNKTPTSGDRNKTYC